MVISETKTTSLPFLLRNIKEEAILIPECHKFKTRRGLVVTGTLECASGRYPFHWRIPSFLRFDVEDAEVPEIIGAIASYFRFMDGYDDESYHFTELSKRRAFNRYF